MPKFLRPRRSPRGGRPLRTQAGEASQGVPFAQVPQAVPTSQDSPVAADSQASQGAPPFKPAPTKTGNFWTGDAKLVVIDHYSGAAALPKPARVAIADFGVQVLNLVWGG